MKKYFSIILGLAVFTACTKEDLIYPIPDSKILELAYDINYQVPVDFYKEGGITGLIYYENSISIMPSDKRTHSWMELSTLDKEQARAWSDLSNENSAENRRLVQENVTPKYYEFMRVKNDNTNDILMSRVHRSNYFEPLYDKFSKSETIGKYNAELALKNCKELVEYLWANHAIGMYEKVIDTKMFETEQSFDYEINSIKIVYSDIGLKDKICIYKNQFILDKGSRLLTLKRELIREIEGWRNERL